MQINKIIFGSALLISALTVGVIGCKKDREADVATSTTTSTTSSTTGGTPAETAEDNSEAEYVFTDSNNIIDDAARSQSGVNKNLGPCYSVNISSGGFPKTITVDFGTTPCIGADGGVRTGSLTGTYYAARNVKGSKYVLTYNNYTVDGRKVSGTATVTATNVAQVYDGGKMVDVPTTWTTVVTDGSVTTATKSHTWHCNKTRVWSAGYDTPSDTKDDVYLFSGSSGGVNSKKGSYSTVIDSNKPLKLLATHSYFVSGVVTITQGNTVIVIDYGDGTPDDKATYTINNLISGTITLH